MEKAIEDTGCEAPDLEALEESAKMVKGTKPLTFHFDGFNIEHTGDEWAAIFYAVGPSYIGCSEW